ncbi:MAG: 50S ribosomal protein L24 [Candidatus Omnitrophota bacterium]
MSHIKKNDIVFITTGKDKGKKGKVLFVNPANGRALVEGTNYAKKATRRTREDQKGGIITKEASIDLSNLLVVCPRCSRPTRIGQSVLADGTKSRMCKKCKELL